MVKTSYEQVRSLDISFSKITIYTIAPIYSYIPISSTRSKTMMLIGEPVDRTFRTTLCYHAVVMRFPEKSNCLVSEIFFSRCCRKLHTLKHTWTLVSSAKVTPCLLMMPAQLVLNAADDYQPANCLTVPNRNLIFSDLDGLWSIEVLVMWRLFEHHGTSESEP